jgi:hypothetical protein
MSEIEEMVAGLELYHGKMVNGFNFIVTPENLAKAAEKIGVKNVKLFFSDSKNPMIYGTLVSEWIAGVQPHVPPPIKKAGKA